ncbi:Phosphatidylinositol 3-/4-kinase [Paracidovorax anthurii]|uniref:Phosphatidylinositol 3-/4-kinase n=1 Tax=Paracidovorax anthurii TaxID=78229 RepID=A0A328YTD5_9BURK|nr:hypothetical protein AX018_105512 [Paracidovorax anthurii]
MVHHQPASRPQGEIRLEPAAAHIPQRQTEPPQARRQTLGELLTREHRQEQAERARQAYAALPHGGKAMQRLKDRAARQHPSTMAEKLNARLQGSPKPMEGPRGRAFAELVRADVLALSKAAHINPLQALETMRGAALESALGQGGILEQDQKLLLNVLDRLGPMIIQQRYEQLNLKLMPETTPAFTDAQVLEKPLQLGNGNFNTVFAVKVMDSEGTAFDAVFKPLNDVEEDWAARKTGVPVDDPQTAMRNIATVSYARAFRFHVIADTRVALIDTGRGPQGPDLGLMMERAQGQPAFEVDAAILERPDVCAEVTRLQLLDHLTGQVDRHDSNYFIHIGPDDRARVTGIDNDQCFGKNLTDPAGIQQITTSDNRDNGFRGTKLPPVVDTTMEHAINAVTETDIRSMLEGKLTEDEVNAAIQRHQGVKDHIARLRADGRVIEPEQWSRSEIQQLLTVENSYVGRELDAALAWQTSSGRQSSSNAGLSELNAALDWQSSPERESNNNASTARRNTW